MLLASVACVGYGNVGTVTKTIDRGNAESLKASFDIGDGQIELSGGADALMESSFTTNDKRTPKVDYSVNGTRGSLTVTQSTKSAGFNVGPEINRWSINLNDDVPTDLSITSKSASTKLNLDTLTVNSLDVSSDSGDATISLSGAQQKLGSVSIRSASGGINLTLDGDYQAPAAVHIDSSSGDVTTNLNGHWTSTLSGTFKTDSGSITITVPKNLDIQISATSDSGYVDASGFTDRGNGLYVNDPAGAPNVTMKLDIQSSNGNITIRTGD